MRGQEQLPNASKATGPVRTPQPTNESAPVRVPPQAHPAPLLQRARRDPRSLTPQDVRQLHRTIGNRVMGRLLTPTAQWQATPNQGSHTNRSDQLKAGVEVVSGLSLDDVNVHYNSPNPAQLQALAGIRFIDKRLEAKVHKSCQLMRNNNQLVVAQRGLTSGIGVKPKPYDVRDIGNNGNTIQHGIIQLYDFEEGEIQGGWWYRDAGTNADLWESMDGQWKMSYYRQSGDYHMKGKSGARAKSYKGYFNKLYKEYCTGSFEEEMNTLYRDFEEHVLPLYT